MVAVGLSKREQVAEKDMGWAMIPGLASARPMRGSSKESGATNSAHPSRKERAGGEFAVTTEFCAKVQL